MSRPVGTPNPKPITANVAPVIRDLMALQVKLELTDDALASAAGYHPDDLSNWRRGKRTPRLRTLADYAQVFDYEIRLVPKGSSK